MHLNHKGPPPPGQEGEQNNRPRVCPHWRVDSIVIVPIQAGKPWEVQWEAQTRVTGLSPQLSLDFRGVVFSSVQFVTKQRVLRER